MTDYGVSTSGFVRKRFPEQLAQIRDELKSGLGEETDLTPDTVLGVLSNIIAERHTAIWELIEQVYAQMYPMSASGSNLDRAVSFTGVSRLQAQPSSVGVVWYGEEGTVIPQYSEVKNTETQVSYFAAGRYTLKQSAAYRLEITAKNSTINANEEIYLTLNGKKYSYTTDRASFPYAMEKLAALIANAADIEMTHSGITLTLTANGVTAFNLNALSDNLTISRLGCYGRAKTDGESTDYAAVGSVTEIVDRIDGLTAVDNLQEGTAGRTEESDSALYLRYHRGVWRTGAATPDSILANLLEVEGVSTAAVYQNNADSSQNGLPPHSLYCVVKGGLNSDIAYCILQHAPVGITLSGSTSVGVKDSQGITHTIRFGRPKKVYIWVNVVTEIFTDQSETVQTGYFAAITDKILAYGDSLNVGDDVILQRIIGKCVEVEGVGKVTVTLGKTALLSDNEPAYAADNITLAADEEAIFDQSIIRVS